MVVQATLSKLAVEALNERVLSGLARLDEVEVPGPQENIDTSSGTRDFPAC